MSSSVNNKQTHINNFDFLRLLFASLVIVTHSYPLSGIPEEDILFRFSKGETSLSGIGVAGFFVISGYLISISLLRSKSIIGYFFKRIIRVFPALWVVVIFSILSGFFVSNKMAADYFSEPTVYKYLLTAFLHIQSFIPGVFADNPLHYINGSLWTVPYEFLFYIMLSTTFFIKNLYHKKFALLMIFTILFTARIFIHLPNNLELLSLSVNNICFLGLFFTAGALLSLFELPSPKNRSNIFIALLIVLITILIFSRFYFLGHIFILPPLIIALGSLNYPYLSWIRKYGDISYGIYIWGFPVQQLLMHYFHFDQEKLLLSSLPITYLLGYLSWHLLEKRALRLKALYN
ncbi:acyltransferase [Hymenobacter sp.]|jgi:peptidoglycan/LPS O-acetylase OafA/YrhL|uniref:acyltransferase family protein n=1 Tax=Hymenobacter sp. TaxID=1898978 RepID=UPI002EDAC027